MADAWRYDAHHEKADRIVRITSKLSGDGAPMHLATSQGPLGPTLKAETPGVAVLFLAGLGALAVALMTVGVKAYRAAMLDPTTALRDE